MEFLVVYDPVFWLSRVLSPFLPRHWERERVSSVDLLSVVSVSPTVSLSCHFLLLSCLFNENEGGGEGNVSLVRTHTT